MESTRQESRKLYIASILSQREIEVIRLGCKGLNSKQMGNILHVSEETIKSHKRNIAIKLKTRSWTHAIATVALLTPHLITDVEAQVE